MKSEQQGQHYKFFCHKECEYFPCHKTDRPETFNCLFCYCPLYALGPDCGGNFRYTEAGVKDCTHCLLPHSSGGYEHIRSRFPALAELAKREPESADGEKEK